MSAATPRLKRHDFSMGHAYTLDCDHGRYRKDDPHKLDGVTTILYALPGPPPSWGADVAATVAVDEWDELAQKPIVDRYNYLKGAPDRYRDSAANRGTDIHRYGEKVVYGEDVEVPPEIQGPVEAYARFLDAWEIEPIAVETPIALTPERGASFGLGRFSCGGTSDLTATIGKRDGARALVDLKSGNTVPQKTGLQCAGYRYADLWQPNGPESEEEQPPVDLVFVAHIGPDAVRMLPVTAGERELKALAYIRMSMRWQQQHDWWFRKPGPDPLIGEAVQP